MKITDGLKRAALASLVCTFGAGAQAVPLITDWNVDQEFEFTAWTQTSGDGTGVVESSPSDGMWGDNVDGYQVLTWMDDDGDSSSISIQSGSGDTVNSNASISTDGVLELADFALGPMVAHNNQAIDASASTLNTATAMDYIVLDPTNPDLPALPPRQLTYDIKFTETLNSLTGADCPPGNPGDGCRDIFTISGPGLTGESADVIDSDNDAFVIDSFILPGDPGKPAIEYTVYLLSEGLGVLSDATCAMAGADPGCFGLITDENTNNQFQFRYAIAARVVPEPAAILLIALGLLGMAGLRSRKSIGGGA